MKKYIILLLYFSFFIFNSSIATAIEVGGHLTENTVWSPDNNPYLVTSGVYVDSGVTLTISPGTIVKFNAVYYDDWGNSQFYFHNDNEEPIAKFIRVEGQIIAEGTEQDSIFFTRIQDEEYYHWGTVYLPEGAELSSFKHCSFRFSAFTGFSLWEQPRAAISAWNGSLIVDNCSFIDNDNAIYIRNNVVNIAITNSYFSNIEYSHPNNMNVYGRFIGAHYILYEDLSSPLIAGNSFSHGTAISSNKSIYFIYNDIQSVLYNRAALNVDDEDGASYYYNNILGSCSIGINSQAMNPDVGSAYIKKNTFDINGGEGVSLNYIYAEVVDNHFENCEIFIPTLNASKIIANTISNTSGPAISCNSNYIINNVISNCEIGLSGRGSSQFSNNLIINNETAFSFLTDNHIIENEIIINNINLLEDPYSPIIYGNPIFRNCILDFDLPEECIDGGGNIWVDSLQAQEIFADIENGDFQLTEGSLAIDTGFDTLDYYYPFDMEYSQRVWDGDEDGNAIIDIGPYEYGSPSFGGIRGNTYNPDTREPINYVLLKINDIAGEFTFSDSIGAFEYKLSEGVYDVFAERVFYDDVIIYEVEVIEGEFTEISIPMFTTTEAQNNGIIIPSNSFKLRNYPNPFKPSGAGRGPATTIEFLIIEGKKISLSIYNIRGQLVKTLLNSNIEEGKHKIIWNGRNESGQSVSSGIYYCMLKSDKQESVKKMILIK